MSVTLWTTWHFYCASQAITPDWRNGQRVGLLIQRFRVRVPGQVLSCFSDSCQARQSSCMTFFIVCHKPSRLTGMMDSVLDFLSEGSEFKSRYVGGNEQTRPWDPSGIMPQDSSPLKNPLCSRLVKCSNPGQVSNTFFSLMEEYKT